LSINANIYGNPRGGLLLIGPNNPRFGICGKAWGVGLDLGHSDPSWDCGEA